MKKLIRKFVEGTDIGTAHILYLETSYFKRVWLYLPSLSGRNGRHLTWKAKHWWSLPFTKPTYWVWSKVKVTCNHCGEDAGS